MTEKELLASLSEKTNSEHASKEENQTSQDSTREDLPVSDDQALNTNNNEPFHGFPTPDDEKTSAEISEENSQANNTETSEDTNSNNEEQLPAKSNSEVAENTKKKSKKEKEKEKKEEGPMTLLDHLKELRVRLTRVIVILFIGFFACYNFAEMAYNFLAIPLTENMPEGSTLMYTSPPGAFFVYLKISLLLSFFLSCPFTFYQIWAFVAPGLYKEEKIVLLPLSFTSAFFFLAGATFCYYLVFPIAFKFFMGFATAEIIPMISIEEYLSFVLKLLLAFGFVFEMPLFAFFLARMGVLTPERMRKWRKYAILIIFIAAALLTPPDIFSQLLMAAPMLFLYEVSILLTVVVAKKRNEKKEKEESEAEENA